jgi:hypothetical protein
MLHMLVTGRALIRLLSSSRIENFRANRDHTFVSGTRFEMTGGHGVPTLRQSKLIPLHVFKARRRELIEIKLLNFKGGYKTG